MVLFDCSQRISDIQCPGEWVPGQRTHAESRRRWKICAPQLPEASATALDQETDHNDKEHSGDYPDNRCAIHISSPFCESEVPYDPGLDEKQAGAQCQGEGIAALENHGAS
jgi:hypothetical protein